MYEKKSKMVTETSDNKQVIAKSIETRAVAKRKRQMSLSEHLDHRVAEETNSIYVSASRDNVDHSANHDKKKLARIRTQLVKLHGKSSGNGTLFMEDGLVIHGGTQCYQKRNKWDCKMSKMAKNTVNPIRQIVDQMKLTPNPEKPMIALSIGDPCVFGNLPPAQEVLDSVKNVLYTNKCNGYAPSVGYETARQAIAEYSSFDGFELSAKDVILTSGCSSALDMCIQVLANPGDNILTPRPGFSIYRTLAESLGISVKTYNLKPDLQWEVDLTHLESLIDSRTAAIVVNNPSNPCGSVYSKEHLQAIAKISESHKIPIIADEIYAHFVFSNNHFHWLASVNSNIPILSCGGLTKRWLIPGWRQGWIVVFDKNGYFSDIRKGLLSLSTRILGPNTVCQGAIPDILQKTSPQFYEDTLKCIEKNANMAYEKLSIVSGLEPIMPQGAMYMMVGIDISRFPSFKNDVDFTENLVTDQSVFCLPAKCFELDNYFRIVLTVPEDMMQEACQRIAQFCSKYCKVSESSVSCV